MRYNTYIEKFENQHIEFPKTFNGFVKMRFVPFISENDNSLDFELALSTAAYYGLDTEPGQPHQNNFYNLITFAR